MAAAVALRPSPAPRNIAAAAEGGNNATATITPTSDEESPPVIESAAAAPEAKASATISGLMVVREINS